MKKHKGLKGLMLVTLGILLVGCSTQTGSTKDSKSEKDTAESVVTEKENSKGKAMSVVLGSTNWQGTKVYDQEGTDLTTENQEFIGLAKYDTLTNYYEFFDKATGETRGDEGTFFITQDGDKRVMISKTKNYQGIVKITELTNKIFTYQREGKDKLGNPTQVYVEHIPYEEELTFTSGRDDITSKETGDIDTKVSGVSLLGEKLWNGTKVLDAEGNDVTAYNQMFISLAKFDGTTNQYEFFDKETGESKGDYGYYDIIANNRIRTHVSIGDNKYGAVLVLTEFNKDRFTYERQGKDGDDNDITVYVEHEPYTGELDPSFSF